MKIIPFYIPKKFIPGLLDYRNSRLAQTRISISSDLPKADAEFLTANKDKLAKIARRNDCHLSFVKNDGFYNNSTKMDIGLPKITFADYKMDEMYNPCNSVCFVSYEKEGDVILPENLQKERKPFEIIKQDIKTIKEMVFKNKK